MRSMPSWSRRGQVEPLAALAAVFAVGVGVSLYVGALDATLSNLTTDHRIAAVALERFLAESSAFGSVRPPVEEAAASARPTGRRLNATLRADGAEWTGGPARPSSSECVARRVSVAVEPGRVRPGILEVCTWRAA